MKKMKRIIIFIIVVCGLAMTVHAETIHVVGTEYPPFTYLQDGVPVGFAIGLLKAMFKETTLEAEFRLFPWERARTMLTEKKNTLAFLARNTKREKLYKWIGPVYPRTIALYRLKTRPEIHLGSADDIGSYKIGVVRGYAGINDLLRAGIPQHNLEDVSRDELNIRKLFEARIDLIANNDLVLAYLLRNEGHSFADVENVLAITGEGESYYYFGMNNKTDDRLVTQLQRALKKLKENGTYGAMLKEYLK